MAGTFIIRKANPWQKGGADGGTFPTVAPVGDIVVICKDAAGVITRDVVEFSDTATIPDDADPVDFTTVVKWIEVSKIVV
jgi:hypothetical protein